MIIMQYDEKTATEIALKHDISEITIRVWKSRGVIPDRYQNPHYNRRKPIPKAIQESDAYTRLIDLLKSKRFNLKALSDFSHVKLHAIRDALRTGKKATKLSESDYKRLVFKLQNINLQIKTTFFNQENEKSFLKLLNHPVLVESNIINDRKLYYRINKIKNGHKTNTFSDAYEEAKAKYFVLSLEISRL